MKKFFKKIIPAIMYEKLACYYKQILFFIFRVVPIDNNKIVFSNFINKGYGDNPKYITEEIIRQNLKYKLVWLVGDTDDNNFPSEIKLVKAESIKGIYEMSTAKVWIDNVRKLEYVRKRKKQYYVQTWHGGLGIKTCEKDAEDKLSPNYIKTAKRDSKMIDICISNGNHISNIYKNSFWYDGEVLVSGSPRNDIFFVKDNNILKTMIKEQFEIDSDTRIALYAPTFRNTTNTEIYKLDYSKCISALNKRFGGKWVFLVRLHPNVSDRAGEIKYDDNIYNASDYDDMQELLVASDILITDYSSSMFDFSLKKSPCFLYMPDLNEYKEDRSLYFRLDDLPFPMGYDNNKLIESILSFDENIYIKKVDDFLTLQGIIENGTASKRVVEKIKEVNQIK